MVREDEKDRMLPERSEETRIDLGCTSARPEQGATSCPTEGRVSEGGTHPRSPAISQPTVIVVGAGVSGCACAASLAASGAQVVLVNSALDILGLPGYGPALIPAQGGWAELASVMSGLPAPLRWAWLGSASVLKDGSPLLLVDRRAVSLETKRALESMTGIAFRQGLVVDVRPAAEGKAVVGPEGDSPTKLMVSGARSGLTELEAAPDESMATPLDTAATVAPGGARGEPSRCVAPIAGRVEVETAFGEVFSADAVVLAVGLGLGGRIAVGSDAMAGGRYGEVAADALRHSLEGQGVRFRRVHMQVGREVSGSRVDSFERIAGALKDSEDMGAIPVNALLDGLGKNSGDGLVAALGAVRDSLLGIAEGGPVGDVMKAEGWPPDYPLAPHRMGGLRLSRALVRRRPGGPFCGRREDVSFDAREGSTAAKGEASSGIAKSDLPSPPHIAPGVAMDALSVGTGAKGSVYRPGFGLELLVSPDCDSTAELYVRPGEEERLAQDSPACRLEHAIAADVIVALDIAGSLPGLPGVWAAGQAAGAVGYLESLRSGIEVANAVMSELGATIVELESARPVIIGPVKTE